MFATAEPQHSLFAHIGHNSAGCSGMRATCTACSNALRACPTMALGAEAPVPISFLMQDSEVPHTESALHLSPLRVVPMQMRMLPPQGSSLQPSLCWLSLLQWQMLCQLQCVESSFCAAPSHRCRTHSSSLPRKCMCSWQKNQPSKRCGQPRCLVWCVCAPGLHGALEGHGLSLYM